MSVLDPWAWIVMGGAVIAYAVLGWIIDLFRPAISRWSGKPERHEEL